VGGGGAGKQAAALWLSAGGHACVASVGHAGGRGFWIGLLIYDGPN
jgi:hypothetical protein